MKLIPMKRTPKQTKQTNAINECYKWKFQNVTNGNFNEKNFIDINECYKWKFQ